MNTKRIIKLARQYKSMVLFYLKEDPKDSVWLKRLKYINKVLKELERKVK